MVCDKNIYNFLINFVSANFCPNGHFFALPINFYILLIAKQNKLDFLYCYDIYLVYFRITFIFFPFVYQD